MEKTSEEKKSFQWKDVFQKIISDLKTLTNLHEDTNIESTIASIKKDVEFKGANVWILFFAVIICSVGLNVNSTAVIIGAMLISPLMGPINGVGLSIGIYDTELLRLSLRNLLIMILVGLVASTFYFLITPITDAQSELLARTRPTLFDVFIAFFGGCAGIVAASRKEGKITVISGVAIATALMPPLCTAGYGIASGQLRFFFGAFYLLFINSFFIAIATFLVTHLLHFPVKQFVDIQRQKVVKRSIIIFSILTIIPSFFLAWNVVSETRFNSHTYRYIQDIQQLDLFSEKEIINVSRKYSRKEKSLTLSVIGKPLTEQQIRYMQQLLPKYGLNNVNLIIKQTGGTFDLGAQTAFIEKLLMDKDIQLQKKDSIIAALNNKLQLMQTSGVNELQLAREVKVQFPDIKQIAFSNSIFINLDHLTQDTVPTIFIQWEQTPPNKKALLSQMNEWLKVRLNLEKLKIIEVEM